MKSDVLIQKFESTKYIYLRPYFSGEELLMTELIFNGVFTELNPSQCVALLSCFMCDEKSNNSVQMTEELSGPLRRMQVIQ